MKLFLVNLMTISVAVAMAQEPKPRLTATTKASTPTTTSSITTTTTEKPTTEVPTTSTNTPTQPPEPTSSLAPPVPVPTLGNFTYMKGDKICAYVLMKITVVQNSTHYPFVDPSLTTSKSSSSNTSVTMWIESKDKDALQLVIEKDESKFFISKLLVVLANGNRAENDKLAQFPTPLNSFYNCTDPFDVSLGKDVRIVFSDMSYQAFQETEAAKFLGKELSCVSAYHSDVVIIAIGCALALLIVVILIAYLIARRKSRQRGYQSV